MAGRVVIMAAGTGGHVFPGLALALELRARGHEVTWLGTPTGMENRLVPQSGIAMDVVPVKGLRRNGLLRWLVAPFALLGAAWHSLQVLRRRQADLVVGMGGYVSGPGGVMARLLGIPLVIHEQNAIPGLANRLLAPLASRVLQAFPDSFPAQRGAVAVGNPVRREILQLAGPEQRFQVAHESPRLLIVGGSLGAQVLNERVAAGVAASGLKLEIRHQAGRGKLQAAQAAYAAAGVEAEVSEFIDDMAAAYGWADLVICRAGALTVSELAAAGVASILVPYPHAVDDHQRHNALFLAKQHAAVLMLQEELNGPALGLLLQGLLAGVDRVREMALAAKRQGVPDAAQRVADICEEVMGR